jgi:hypothetical protein
MYACAFIRAAPHGSLLYCGALGAAERLASVIRLIDFALCKEQSD